MSFTPDQSEQPAKFRWLLSTTQSRRSAFLRCKNSPSAGRCRRTDVGQQSTLSKARTAVAPDPSVYNRRMENWRERDARKRRNAERVLIVNGMIVAAFSPVLLIAGLSKDAGTLQNMAVVGMFLLWLVGGVAASLKGWGKW